MNIKNDDTEMVTLDDGLSVGLREDVEGLETVEDSVMIEDSDAAGELETVTGEDVVIVLKQPRGLIPLIVLHI